MDLVSRGSIRFARAPAAGPRGIIRWMESADSFDYRPDEARRQAGERRQAASPAPRKVTDRIWELIVSKLRLQWSPRQIAGWLRLKCIVSVSFRWIYRRIRADREAVGTQFRELRQQGRKLKKRVRRLAPGLGTLRPSETPGLTHSSDPATRSPTPLPHPRPVCISVCDPLSLSQSLPAPTIRQPMLFVC